MSKLGKVGPYALLERLGRGGMGEVYLASSRRGERVALKVLHELTEDDSSRIRLEREVRALRRVESPYVARVLDADLGCARPYLVMENIEGVTLLDRVRQDGPLDLPQLVQLAQGIAAALAIIHAAGVVHRDLKPANIIMGADGPVLIDFGIAQVHDATRLTMTGTFLGTPGYTAPEIFADEQVDSPADIHAWAATVAFAATGRPAFGRGTAEAQMYAVLNGRADLKGVPVALLPLVRAALNREPAKRPTAALLADRLSRLAKATGVPDASGAPAGLLAAPVAEETRERPGEARGRAEGRGRPGEPRGRAGEEAKPPAPRKAPGEDGRGSGPRPRPGGDVPARGRADAAARARAGGDTDPRGRTADAAARGRTTGGGTAAADGAARGRVSGGGGADVPARGRGAGVSGAEGAARGRGAGAGGADVPARGRSAGTDGGARREGEVPAPRGRAAADTTRGRATGESARSRASAESARSRAAAESGRGRATGEGVRTRTAVDGAAVPAPRGRTDARARARAVEGAARARARAAIGTARGRGGRAASGEEPGGTGLPAGSAALMLLAVLAVPCVVASVMWPIASIGITAVFVVLTRTVWTSHWLARKRPSRRWRIALRVLLFPIALAGSAVTAVVWPGVPVAVAAGGALWLTGGGEIHSDWWQQAAPVTAAGVVFGMLCGGITGREIERVGARLPELRREGLRALAVLGGFVALCAAAVRAIALLL
ncbi:serine/threonine-protein kinase [Nonomuraea muscovyensis]